MNRHHPTARSRAGIGIVVVSVVLTLLGLGVAPAQAAGTTTTAPAAHATTTHRTPLDDGRCEAGDQRVARRCAPGPQQFSEGGCGFLQRCVYFNRTEQTYLITGSKWIVQAALCAAGLGFGCIVAGVLVEIGAQYLLGRGGVCPTSKPRLRVQWFPTPQVEGCVA